MKPHKDYLDTKVLEFRLDSLPTLPQVTSLLLRLLHAPDASAQEIETVATKDPAMVAEVLKVINSARYALRHRVSDVRHAITLLGFTRIKAIVVSLSMFRLLRSLPIRQHDHLRQFWIHSAVMAGVCRRGAEFVAEVQPEDAFVAGLLHDIGKIVLLAYFPKPYGRIVQAAEKDQTSFAEIEEQFAEMNHARIGEFVTRKWNLASTVQAAIRWHHEPAHYPQVPLAGICYVANHICKNRGLACAGSCETSRLDPSAWEQVGLPNEAFFEMSETAPAEEELAISILEAAGG